MEPTGEVGHKNLMAYPCCNKRDIKKGPVGGVTFVTPKIHNLVPEGGNIMTIPETMS